MLACISYNKAATPTTPATTTAPKLIPTLIAALAPGAYVATLAFGAVEFPETAATDDTPAAGTVAAVLTLTIVVVVVLTPTDIDTDTMVVVAVTAAGAVAGGA